MDTITGKFGEQSPAQHIPAQRQLWQQQEDVVVSSRSPWGGRQCHTENFEGTRTMVPSHSHLQFSRTQKGAHSQP